MSKTLYIIPDSGISGDMTVGALLSLGADRTALEKALSSIPADGFKTLITQVDKSGQTATDFDVILEIPNHDHDMHYLYDPDYREDAETHSEGHHDGHHGDRHDGCGEAGGDHDHEHGHHHDHHHGRNLADVTEIINATDMTEGARSLALKIFGIIADAEAKAHETTVEQVHFHEVGAIDSIVDVIAAAVCIDSIGADRIVSLPLHEGCGRVRCQHGLLDVPVPAVKNIVEAYDLPLEIMGWQGEYVTPTGAAIVAAVSDEFITEEKFENIFQNKARVRGYGAGKREGQGTGLLTMVLA